MCSDCEAYGSKAPEAYYYWEGARLVVSACVRENMHFLSFKIRYYWGGGDVPIQIIMGAVATPPPPASGPYELRIKEARINEAWLYMKTLGNRYRSRLQPKYYIVRKLHNINRYADINNINNGLIQEVRTPLFGPRCRLFNIGPKVGPPPGPPFLHVHLRWTPPPFQKSWSRPCKHWTANIGEDDFEVSAAEDSR